MTVPSVPAVGDQVAASWGDIVAGWGAAWSVYTPALTAATTNPTIASPTTLVGAYVQQGKTVRFRIILTIGASGFTAGSGAYFFSLPATPNALPSSNVGVCGTAVIWNGARRLYIASLESASRCLLSRTTSEAVLDNTGPGAAWASTNTVAIMGTYEST